MPVHFLFWDADRGGRLEPFPEQTAGIPEPFPELFPELWTSPDGRCCRQQGDDGAEDSTVVSKNMNTYENINILKWHQRVTPKLKSSNKV